MQDDMVCRGEEEMRAETQASQRFMGQQRHSPHNASGSVAAAAAGCFALVLVLQPVAHLHENNGWRHIG